jgi:outer membrane protein TolC
MRAPALVEARRARALPRSAGLAALLALASGCALSPGRWVSERAAPPERVAREAAQETAAAPPASTPAPPAAPEPAPPPAPRSLADLVDLALSRDPATRATWHDARAAAAQAGGVRSLYLPSVDASAGLVRQKLLAAPTRPSVVQSTLGASAAVTWILLDLGARGALVDEADRLLAAARLGEHAAVADLVLRVQQSYFQYLAARALLDAEAAAVKQAEASLAAAEGRQRAGLATIADVLQARTALSQVRLAYQQVEGQALAARGALATLAGLAPTAELEVGELPAAVDAGAAEPQVDDLLAAASLRNPDLGRARASAEAAAARARAASRAAWPVLAFQGSAGVSRFLDPSGLDASTSWSAGLVVRIPTFEGNRPAYEALAAREAADAARERADATAQRVALDVWTSWQALRTAGRRIATARDLLDSASASADVAAGRYREGVGSIVDLLNAQAALELARAEDVRARTDFLVGLAQLARATGRLELPAPPDAAPEGSKAP